jgi:hypothetical protein
MLRIFVAFLGGVVATVLPFALFWGSHRFDSFEAGFCLLAGSFVFSVSATDKPRWYLGTVLGFLFAMAETAYVATHYGDGPITRTLFLVFLGLFTFGGIFFGSTGGLIGRFVFLERANSNRVTQSSFLKPWHLGVAVLVVDLLVTGTIWAIVR